MRFPTNQSGATLVVSLIILLAMTLIAVSMINSATLQEQMAANNRQKTVSRYAAEAALNQAEKMILVKKLGATANMAPLFDNTVKGYYSAVNLQSDVGISKRAVPIKFDITDMSAWDDTVNSIAIDGVIDNTITAKAPQYLVEYMGRQQLDSVPTKSLDASSLDQSRWSYFFRVVAIGWGRDPEIYTILQSTYRLTPMTLPVKSTAVRENGRISWSMIH